MNLLTAELTMTKIELDMARDSIMRATKRGVSEHLRGLHEPARIEAAQLNGIWRMAPNHPLGYLAHRGQLLMTAAWSHTHEAAYFLHPTDKKLAGFIEGEAA